MVPNIVFVHDLFEKDTSPHEIPLRALVEINETGERLFVCEQTRDLDGTPLYSLCTNRDLNLDFSDIWARAYSSWDGGYNKDSLTLIRLP